MELNEKDIKLLKECLPDLVEKYEENLDALYDHETSQIEYFKRNIKGIESLIERLEHTS